MTIGCDACFMAKVLSGCVGRHERGWHASVSRDHDLQVLTRHDHRAVPRAVEPVDEGHDIALECRLCLGRHLKTHRSTYAPAGRPRYLGEVEVPQSRGVRGRWLANPEGSRSPIGALLLGYHTDDGRLHYARPRPHGSPHWRGCWRRYRCRRWRWLNDRRVTAASVRR